MGCNFHLFNTSSKICTYLLCYNFPSSTPSWVAVCFNVHGKGCNLCISNLAVCYSKVLPLYSMKNTCRNILKFAYVSSVVVESTCRWWVFSLLHICPLLWGSLPFTCVCYSNFVYFGVLSGNLLNLDSGHCVEEMNSAPQIFNFVNK